MKREWLGGADHGVSAGSRPPGGLAGKETIGMQPFKKCPICGGEVIPKSVEKLLRGGNHTAILQVGADVRLHCGERLYSRETIRRFEQIRAKLERQETSEFELLGQSFRVA